MLDALRALDADDTLDYVSVVAGTSATLVGLGPHRAADELRARVSSHRWPQRVKDAVSVPVMVAGRINQPQEGEQVLANGQADLVAMTRAMICDPVMPAKAEQGLVDEIRACIGCNQACIGHFHAGYPISCIQHPETGRELTYGIRRPAVGST